MAMPEYLEDCMGHLWERDHIPAEHDVYQKMKPVWKRLYYGKGYYEGELLYEGFTVDDMAYGAGTSYYGGGGRCQEGVFGPNGLICGREYYNNGQLRFEGTYQYNPDFSQNWPIFGAFYLASGELKYYGTFDVIGTSDKVIRPLVMEPEDFGPVTSLLFVNGYLFRGEKAKKYYEVSVKYKEQLRKAEDEKLWKICSREKTLKRLRNYLYSTCPEARDIAVEELMHLGAWTARDQAVLEQTRKRCRPPMTRLSPGERYQRDLEVLDIPASVLLEHLERMERREDGEFDSLLSHLSRRAESMFPYRWGKDPRHEKIGIPLEKRGINQENWLWRLDEMTDREISYMLDQEPGIGRRNEGRIVHPEASEREYAEFMLYFGL